MKPALAPNSSPRFSHSTRERVYRHIKSGVLSGKFSPGERLVEEHLAEAIGVSRTPVREALHKLELEGLVRPLETRGFCVSEDSRDDMEELFELRAILEGYTLRIACTRATEKDLLRLGRCIDKAAEALKRKAIEDVFKWNTRFHDALHDLIAPKRRLHQMIVEIRKYVLRYRKDSLRFLASGQRTLEGHRKIILALQLRDPDLCERVMRKHIEEAKEDALQSFWETGWETGKVSRPPRS